MRYDSEAPLPLSEGRVALLWVLAAGLVLRMAIWFAFADLGPQIADARDYNRLAVGLAEAGGYVDADGQPTSLRPPLFPALVAAIYSTFGIEDFQAVRAFHALLSMITTLVVFQLGREVYDERTGVLAATGYCFYPSLLGFNNLLLSEGVFTFFVAVSTWMSVVVIRRPQVWPALLLGVSLALGALTRSILWLFAPLLALYLACAIRATFVRRLGLVAAMLLVFALTLAPWVYRNTRLQKTFTAIDVMGGRNVMMGNYEHTPLERSWATIELVTGEKSWHRVLAAEHGDLSVLTQGQLDKLAMKHGVRYFLNHPAVSLKRSLVKFFNFWQLERTLVAGMAQGVFGDVAQPVLLGAAISIVGAYVFVLFSAVFGAVLRRPENPWVHGLLLLTIAFPCVLHSIAFAHSRYHLPIVPVLLVYGAAFWTHRRQALGKSRRIAILLAAVVCAIFVLSWLRELVMVDMPELRLLL